MKKQRTISRAVMLITVLSVILGASSVQAITVRDFEGIPDAYVYNGGNQNLGNYYPDLYFGPAVKVYDRTRFGGYNDTGYPPHSGDAVIGSDPGVDYIQVDFIGISPDYVEAWYTCNISSFYMEAYDALDNLIDSSIGPPNYGSNSLISVSGASISYVKFHNGGNLFAIDDFGYVPEPATMALFSLGVLSLIRRKTNK